MAYSELFKRIRKGVNVKGYMKKVYQKDPQMSFKGIKRNKRIYFDISMTVPESSVRHVKRHKTKYLLGAHGVTGIGTGYAGAKLAHPRRRK